MRRLRLAASCVLLLAGLSGCAERTAETRASTPAATEPAVPAAEPATTVDNETAPAGLAPKTGDVDRSCKVDADCAVKDVGNCCGYYPACVNKDSPTFPEQVQAQCKAEGRMAVCGFKDIQGCACVDGQCAEQASNSDALPVQ